MIYHISSDDLPDNQKELLPLLSAVLRNCEMHKAPFFLIGAMARDLVAQSIFHIQPFRATMDLDLAVMVAGWDSYHTITQTLIADYGFSHTHIPHKLNSPQNIEVDFLPFGEIEENGKIFWPSGKDKSFIMNMIGFQEAYRSALSVIFNGDMEVKIASLEGIAHLKISAWNDRKNTSGGQKHIEDLRFLLKNYFEVLIQGEFSNLELTIFDEYELDFDTVLVGSRILGIRIGKSMKKDSDAYHSLLRILKNEYDAEIKSLFIQTLVGRFPPLNDPLFCRKCLKALILGLQQ